MPTTSRIPMANNSVQIRFDNVSFAYNEDHPILEDASFSVRENAKITIMGQNGAGKSTIFKMILGAQENPPEDALKPQQGSVHIHDNASIAIARQVMPKACESMTILEYFETAFSEKKYNIEKLIADVLMVVNLEVPLDRKVGALSGGQQARILLAHALIQKPDILLLDEPTNNLDTDGINNLTMFLIMYEKTVMVISHDAGFLNSFTDGVLQLDVRTQKVEQYVGNYNDVVEQIAAQIEREEKKNAQLRRNILDRKEKVNFFANKGGKMRKLASKLKDEIEEDEENMVEVKQDDRTIRAFTIPAQHTTAAVVTFSEVGVISNGEKMQVPVDMNIWKRDRVLITGPNGIGKSTLLKALADKTSAGAVIAPDVVVGYYRQDFSGLKYDQTVFDSLLEVSQSTDPKDIYGTAGHFLLSSKLLQNTVASLSEGQKGLLCYARFVLQRPGLLILDEPTNHINFRHLPIIAEAINNFEGAVILVSHMEEFVNQISITQTLDLAHLLKKAKK